MKNIKHHYPNVGANLCVRSLFLNLFVRPLKNRIKKGRHIGLPLLTIAIFCILIIKYSSSFTGAQTIAQTNNSTTPITQNPNIISLDKESQLLFKLRTTPVTNKVVQNSTPIPATIKMRPQSRAVVSSATGGILKMKRILGLGDIVKKDEVLAIVQQPLSVPDQITLDAYKIEQRTRRIKVEDDVDHSRKLLVIANVELNRAHKLYEAGAISLKRLQEAEQKVEFASIETAHALRNLIDIGEKDSSFDNSLSIKSPITGVVVSIDATNGQQINSGTSLLTIVDLSTVWIEAQIFEADISKLYKATSISYQVPAIDNKAHTITLSKNKPILATTINPTTRTVAAYFEIPNPDNSLLDGLVVELALNSNESQKKLAIPIQAITEENGQKIVFVYKGGEQFEKRIVTLGAQNKTDVEVLSGLDLAERVVIEGLYQLKAKK